MPKMSRATQLSLLRKTLIFGLVIYSALLTIIMFRVKPHAILIGIDQYGTRVISAAGDRLLKKEKENFLKHFLALLYSYNEETFETRISDCGDLMTKVLWAAKKQEFLKLKEKLKTEPLTQIAEITELREIDQGEYEADVSLKIRRKLTENTIKLRVQIRVKSSARAENDPYPFEVENYDESLS